MSNKPLLINIVVTKQKTVSWTIKSRGRSRQVAFRTWQKLNPSNPRSSLLQMFAMTSYLTTLKRAMERMLSLKQQMQFLPHRENVVLFPIGITLHTAQQVSHQINQPAFVVRKLQPDSFEFSLIVIEMCNSLIIL